MALLEYRQARQQATLQRALESLRSEVRSPVHRSVRQSPASHAALEPCCRCCGCHRSPRGYGVEQIGVIPVIGIRHSVAHATSISTSNMRSSVVFGRCCSWPAVPTIAVRGCRTLPGPRSMKSILRIRSTISASGCNRTFNAAPATCVMSVVTSSPTRRFEQLDLIGFNPDETQRVCVRWGFAAICRRQRWNACWSWCRKPRCQGSELLLSYIDEDYLTSPKGAARRFLARQAAVWVSPGGGV